MAYKFSRPVLRPVHIAVLLFLVGQIMFVIPQITAPISDGMSMIKIEEGRDLLVNLGVLGYCVGQRQRGDIVYACSDLSLGYSIDDATSVFKWNEPIGLGKGVSGVFIINTVAAIAAAAAIVTVGLSHKWGMFPAAVVASVTFLVALITLISNFAVLQIIKSRSDDRGADASYGTGAYLMIAGFVIVNFAFLVTMYFWWTDRKARRAQAPQHLPMSNA